MESALLFQDTEVMLALSLEPLECWDTTRFDKTILLLFLLKSCLLGQICAMIKGGWNVEWNDTQKVPYAYHANQWIGYDNVKSLTEKVKFLKQHNLGGGMVWSVDTDDFSGHCGEGKYPLLKTISSLLNNGKRSVRSI